MQGFNRVEVVGAKRAEGEGGGGGGREGGGGGGGGGGGRRRGGVDGDGGSGGGGVGGRHDVNVVECGGRRSLAHAAQVLLVGLAPGAGGGVVVMGCCSFVFLHL